MQSTRIFKIVFSVIGLILLTGAGYAAFRSLQFQGQATRVSGTVIELREQRSSKGSTYKPVVAYQDASGHARTYVSSTSASPPAYSEGEAVELLVSPADSTDIKINAFMDLWGVTLVLSIIGAPFLLIGLGMTLYDQRKKIMRARVLETGQGIDADIQSIELDESISVNGKHPFKVVCQWLNPQTRQVHVFESEPIWYDPTSYLEHSKLRVYIDRDDPSKYLVDISTLPKLAA